MRRQGWKVLSFPAIAEVDETHVVETIFGRLVFRRKTGEALHAEWETPWRRSKPSGRRSEPYNFAAGQYQQSPAPAGGGMVRVEWFARYEPELLDRKFEQIIQSWDTGGTSPPSSRIIPSAPPGGFRKQHFYLLNVFRKKLGYPDLKSGRARATPVVRSFHRPDRGQGFRHAVDPGARRGGPFRSSRDGSRKEIRSCGTARAQTATIENGFVHLPASAPWLADYLHELTVFPNGRHDDQVDSPTAQAIAWTKQRSAGMGHVRMVAASCGARP